MDKWRRSVAIPAAVDDPYVLKGGGEGRGGTLDAH